MPSYASVTYYAIQSMSGFDLIGFSNKLLVYNAFIETAVDSDSQVHLTGLSHRMLDQDVLRMQKT